MYKSKTARLDLSSGKVDREYRTTRRSIGDFDPAVVVFDNAITYRETEASAALAVFRGIEWLEDLVALLGRNTHTRVGDGNDHILLLRCYLQPGTSADNLEGRDGKFSTLRHGLNRVEQ